MFTTPPSKGASTSVPTRSAVSPPLDAPDRIANSPSPPKPIVPTDDTDKRNLYTPAVVGACVHDSDPASRNPTSMTAHENPHSAGTATGSQSSSEEVFRHAASRVVAADCVASVCGTFTPSESASVTVNASVDPATPPDRPGPNADEAAASAAPGEPFTRIVRRPAPMSFIAPDARETTATSRSYPDPVHACVDLYLPTYAARATSHRKGSTVMAGSTGVSA